MRPLFSKSIDVILEENAADAFQPASAVLQKLNDVKNNVRTVEAELKLEVDGLSHQLALQIRRRNPSLSTSIDRNGRCIVRYKNYSNFLSLTPNPATKSFEVGNSPFDRRFIRYHGHTLSLGPDTLASAIAVFFRQNYGSLRKLEV